MLASVGRRTDIADIYRMNRANMIKSPVTPDPRDPGRKRLGKVKEMFDPYLLSDRAHPRLRLPAAYSTFDGQVEDIVSDMDASLGVRGGPRPAGIDLAVRASSHS